MAGKLAVWGNAPAHAVKEAIADAGIASGLVEYYTGTKPPIMQGGTLLVLGNNHVAEMAKLGVLPKNRTVTSLRSDTHQWNGNNLRVSYSPAMKSLNSSFYTDFLTDLLIAVRLATTGSIDPTLGSYKYVDDFSDYCNQLQSMTKLSIVPIIFDTETIGLDYLRQGDLTHPAARFVSLQLSIRAGESHVVYFGSMQEQEDWFAKHLDQLKFLFRDPSLSMGGANLTYDLKWLRHFTGLTCQNFKFDTTLVGSLLDENRSNSLTVHTKLYVPSLGGYSDDFDARTDKSRMDLVNKSDLLAYGGGDTDACYQVRQRMTEELKKDPKLATFYIKVLHPAQQAFGEAEFNGVHVDMDRYSVLEKDLKDVLAGATKKAAEAIGGRIFAKHRDDSKMGGINITKASLIKDFMFSPMGLNLKPKMTTAKSGAPSTAREHIEMFSDIPEAKAFIDAFSEYGSAAKMLSTYVTGFQKHLRSDGKFHPSYFLFMGDKHVGEGGTVTGRLSARNPAFQTLPKHSYWGKRIRSCFTAPEGYLVTEKDYSQGELKVVACMANELNMIEAYRQGKDLHVLTAALVNDMSYGQLYDLKSKDYDLYDRLRSNGKAGNFGLLYGMSAAGFQAYAATVYGVHMTLQEAEDFRTAYLYKSYPALPDYHEVYKQMARNKGYIVSPLGRKRHLPLAKSRNQEARSGAERQAINSGVQSTLSDMLCWAMAISHKQGNTAHAPCFGAIHDATYNYVPEDNWEKWVKKDLEIMENLPFDQVGWKPQLSFTADAKIGVSMGELEDCTFS